MEAFPDFSEVVNGSLSDCFEGIRLRLVLSKLAMDLLKNDLLYQVHRVRQQIQDLLVAQLNIFYIV